MNLEEYPQELIDAVEQICKASGKGEKLKSTCLLYQDLFAAHPEALELIPPIARAMLLYYEDLDLDIETVSVTTPGELARFY
jgi:hypothetical protein